MKYEAKNGKIPINPANSMTFLRIIGSFCLLFIPACSAMFLAIYTLAGVTDVLDGWLARKTGTASAWGARLDSIADLFFLRGSVSQNFSHSEASRWDLVWGYCGPAAACYKNQASTTIRAYLKQTEKRSNYSV